MTSTQRAGDVADARTCPSPNTLSPPNWARPKGKRRKKPRGTERREETKQKPGLTQIEKGLRKGPKGPQEAGQPNGRLLGGNPEMGLPFQQTPRKGPPQNGTTNSFFALAKRRDFPKAPFPSAGARPVPARSVSRK